MAKEQILIKKGTLKALYKDGHSHQLLSKLGGKATIKRASHVEAPLQSLDNIEFEVDLTPSGGPILKGYKSYQEAVEAEVEWLNKNILNTKKVSP
jgi:hypothetical protein